jgi:hypothetical protein
MKSSMSPLFVVDGWIAGVVFKFVIILVLFVRINVSATPPAESQQEEPRYRKLQMDAPAMRSLSDFLNQNSMISSTSSLSLLASSPLPIMEKEDSFLKMSMSGGEGYKPVFQLHTQVSTVYSKDAHEDKESSEEKRLLLSSTHDLKLQHEETTVTNALLKDKYYNVKTSGRTCDVQFMECLGHAKCVACFQDFEKQDIDWSIIAPNMPCDNVLNVVVSKNGLCSNLMNDNVERNVFCQTFDSCVIWKQDNSDTKTPDNGDDVFQNDDKEDNMDGEIDCDSLSSCDWKGMKHGYIGDGICHDFIDGCYNTKVCNFDGGD